MRAFLERPFELSGLLMVLPSLFDLSACTIPHYSSERSSILYY
jgi:hypothetical protein